MKKYIVSGGLVVVSVMYALWQSLGVHADEAVLTPVAPAPTSTPLPVAKTSIASSKPTTATTITTVSSPAMGRYHNGSYTGSVANAYYGYVQVKAVVSGGKLSAVQILQYPNDRSTSRFINSQALPVLEQEAITIQGATVDSVSGASDTSGAFRESLGTALAQA